MLATDERTARTEASSRRLEEIRELETIWSISEDGTRVEERPTLRGPLYRFRVALAFAAGWIAFLTVLLAFAPAADPEAPAWVTNTSGVMATALLLAPLGIISRVLGYGASVVAAGCGLALAVSCFNAGHTGLWGSYQFAGFAVLAAAGATMLVRTTRQ